MTIWNDIGREIEDFTTRIRNLRLNKSFVHPRWKMTLYGEMLNTLNHKNLRYLGIVGDYTNLGLANLASSLARVPAVGISVEF